MKFLKLTFLLGSAFLFTSCATNPVGVFDPKPNAPIPENAIVYKFTDEAERKFFHEMYPAGSTVPEVAVYETNIHIASWLRPDGRKQERVAAVWTIGKPYRGWLKSSGSISGFYDATGKQMRVEAFVNSFFVNLSGKLFYIVGSPDLEVELPQEN